MTTDTIAAIATPPGRGGIGIVRVSGPATPAIASVLCGALPRPRYAELRAFRAADDTVIDQGIALFFPAPHSFTGEPVLELQGHGGPVVMDMLLARVLELGARLARPGEFTERAFLNEKLDLAQAEAVADLIEASTAAAARAAMGSLQGVFSQQVNALVEGLIQLRLYVESAIDFPEEEIDFLSDGHVATQLGGLQSQLRRLLNEAGQGQLLRDGMSIVIAGQPNAGKSSLLNQLAGRDSAIVTAIPGTTRDVLREYIDIDGMPLRIIDTAGLRESSDLVEQEGIRRAWREIETADRVLLVIDSRDGMTTEDQAIRARLPASVPLTLILNKIDLSQETPGEQTGDWGPVIKLSAKTGTGLDVLRQHLKACMGYQASGEGAFIARRRHLDALRRAAEQLANAQVQLEQYQAGELVAEELRLAQNHLSEITGEFTSDDLLGRIFSSFCIGK
ncbi:MAG: tRNA uridine-5-carboxymethylaminomethyl(34) synthesis GTPase MnmE [Gammaproteobacteria bacterium]